jgi:hypothetical protein
MIGCDDCDNWFHPQCLEKLGVKISETTNIADFPFSCRECVKRKKLEETRLAKEKKLDNKAAGDKLKKNDHSQESGSLRKREIKAN